MNGETGGKFRYFNNDCEAEFLSRPNRFVILAGTKAGEILRCHCPNPGRLMECLFPGASLILEKNRNPAAKTSWTAGAVIHRGAVMPLYAARANGAARALALPGIIPDLRETHSEFSLGASRFDFLCIDGRGRRHLVEVKACSLVEYGAAMFPDAPSLRAGKHLEELAELSEKGYACHVLFVIVHGNPDVFIPNLHTDPAFASLIWKFRDKLNLHTAYLPSNTEGYARLENPDVPIDLSLGPLAGEDRGSYLVVLSLPHEKRITTGALGEILYRRGWYVYAGSAQRNLDARVARHKRKTRKKFHWHIDYLLAEADGVETLKIAGFRNLECSLARSLRELGGSGVKNFGASDCSCCTHLFFFAENPMLNRAFIDMVLLYRHVRALEKSRRGAEGMMNYER